MVGVLMRGTEGSRFESGFRGWISGNGNGIRNWKWSSKFDVHRLL